MKSYALLQVELTHDGTVDFPSLLTTMIYSWLDNPPVFTVAVPDCPDATVTLSLLVDGQPMPDIQEPPPPDWLRNFVQRFRST